MDSPRPLFKQPRLSAATLMIGLCAGFSQVVLLRELMVLAGGNELSLGLGLAGWLLWAAAGSLGASIIPGRTGRPGLTGPLLLAGLGGIVSLILARLAPAGLGWQAGSVPSLGQSLLISLTALGPAGLADGAAFVLVLAAAGRERAEPGLLSWLYGADSLGHTAAAALFGLLLVRWLNPVALVSAAALAGALAALLLSPGRGRRLVLAWCALLAAGLVLSSSLDASLRARLWPGRQLAGRAESPYAQLLAFRSAGQTDFFASGLWLFSRPDRQRLERAALLPLLARPGAERVLFIGGAAEGVAAEALRRGRLSQVTAVELDPWLVRFAEQLWPAEKRPAGLKILSGDGRAFLERSQRQFDLIVVESPPPVTVQLNRYYSREGLAALARALRPGGVAALSLPGLEGLVGRLQAQQLGSILAAARTTFGQVVIMSGPELRLFLSPAPGGLPVEPWLWQERLVRAGWPDLVAVRPDVLTLELDPFRLAQLAAVVKEAGPQPANGDLRPRALLLDPQLWGASLGGWAGLAETLARLRLRHLFWPILIGAGLCLAAMARPGPRPALLPLGVFITGLTSTALSVLLLMGYQILFGAVYVGLAGLLAGFMLGLAGAALTLGSDRWPLRPRLAGLALISALLALACLASLGLVQFLSQAVKTPAARLALVLLAGLDGGLTGAYFGLAGRLRLARARAGSGPDSSLARAGGRLYGLDLAGGLIGALAPVVLVPTVGLDGALISLAGLNLIPLAGWAGQAVFKTNPKS